MTSSVRVADPEVGDVGENLADQLLRVADMGAAKQLEESCLAEALAVVAERLGDAVGVQQQCPAGVDRDRLGPPAEVEGAQERTRLAQLDRRLAIGQVWRRVTGVGVLADPSVDIHDGDDGRQQIGAASRWFSPREPVERSARAHTASQRRRAGSSST